MRIRFAAAPVLALSLFAAGAHAQADTQYTIRFERPFAPGQGFSVRVVDTSHAVQAVALPDGTGSRTETTRKLTLDADALIDQVDERGQEQVILLTLRRVLQQTSSPGTPATSVDLVPANSHLRVEFQADKVIFTLENGKLTEAATTALQQIFKPHKTTRVTDDERYGTATPKKIGDTWPVDVKSLVKDRATSSVIDSSNVIGTVTLKGVKPVAAMANTPCAEVEAVVQMRGIPVQGLTPRESTLKIVVTNLLPTDTARPGVSSTIKTNMHVLIEQPGGGEGTGIVQTTVDSDILRTTDWKLQQ